MATVVLALAARGSVERFRFGFVALLETAPEPAGEEWGQAANGEADSRRENVEGRSLSEVAAALGV